MSEMLEKDVMAARKLSEQRRRELMDGLRAADMIAEYDAYSNDDPKADCSRFYKWLTTYRMNDGDLAVAVLQHNSRYLWDFFLAMKDNEPDLYEDWKEWTVTEEHINAMLESLPEYVVKFAPAEEKPFWKWFQTLTKDEQEGSIFIWIERGAGTISGVYAMIFSPNYDAKGDVALSAWTAMSVSERASYSEITSLSPFRAEVLRTIDGLLPEQKETAFWQLFKDVMTKDIKNILLDGGGKNTPEGKFLQWVKENKGEDMVDAVIYDNLDCVDVVQEVINLLPFDNMYKDYEEATQKRDDSER